MIRTLAEDDEELPTLLADGWIPFATVVRKVQRALPPELLYEGAPTRMEYKELYFYSLYKR